ncbi:MAG: BRO family protein [Acinetobacter sp.]|jgi:prophage antirepressor-like protein
MKPTILDFKGHSVRIALDQNNEPLFCLADVCKSLDMQRANPSRFNLNPRGTHSLCTPTTSGNQNLTFISEENLYRIVFRSTKPEALNFQNWVFAEVLPTIRKTGSYTARQTAFDEFNRICMQEKVSKEKGTFHSHGMHRRKHEKRLNALRINTCKANIQLTFEGVTP